MKTVDDAIRIRDTVWRSSCTRSRLSVVVGGGGPTAVELACELQPWLNEITSSGQCRIGITLVHAGATVMDRFPQRVTWVVAKRLARLKVRVLTDERIVAVDAPTQTLHLESGAVIPYDVLIWAGGVKPSSALGRLPARHAADGRLLVASDLSLLADGSQPLHGKVYGVGDAVLGMEWDGDAPMTARAAISQASVAAYNVIADVRGTTRVSHRPARHPFFLSVGGKSAVAQLGPFVLNGSLGWLVKGAVELGYLLAILPRGLALRVWLRGVWVFVLNHRMG